MRDLFRRQAPPAAIEPPTATVPAEPTNPFDQALHSEQEQVELGLVDALARQAFTLLATATRRALLTDRAAAQRPATDWEDMQLRAFWSAELATLRDTAASVAQQCSRASMRYGQWMQHQRARALEQQRRHGAALLTVSPRQRLKELEQGAAPPTAEVMVPAAGSPDRYARQQEAIRQRERQEHELATYQAEQARRDADRAAAQRELADEEDEFDRVIAQRVAARASAPPAEPAQATASEEPRTQWTRPDGTVHTYAPPQEEPDGTQA